jgi:CheY-like chemotaxis protein
VTHPAPPPPAPHDDATPKARVMVIDDNEVHLEVARIVLEKRGFVTELVSQPAEVLERVKRAPPDLIILDVMMPEMDGYETMRAIRENPAMSRLPIIALTAKAMKGDREKCMEAGASDYITKPIDAQQLVSLLRVWLYR